MKVEIVEEAQLPQRTAEHLAGLLREAVERRGMATLAVSGGGTPVPMFAALVGEPVPWPSVHVFQVDERIAPDGDPDRNLGELTQNLVARLPEGVRLAGLHPMAAAAALDGDAAAASAAAQYEALLARIAGTPPVLDVVHLGLGEDGHTASLLPGDPVLDVTGRDVAVTQTYQGRRRLTLTFPALARARSRVWYVTGSEKAEVVARLVAGDPTLAAGRIPQEATTLFVDNKAAARLR